MTFFKETHQHAASCSIHASTTDLTRCCCSNVRQQHTGHATFPMQTEALLPCSVGHLAASVPGPAVPNQGRHCLVPYPVSLASLLPVSSSAMVSGRPLHSPRRCASRHSQVHRCIIYSAVSCQGAACLISGGQWRRPVPSLRRGLPGSRWRRPCSSDLWAVGWQGPRRWRGGAGSRGLPCSSRCPQGMAE